MKKIVFILVLTLTTLVQSWAQDPHFSQFYMSPLTLNPALTGLISCNYRVSANYRGQWASVLRPNELDQKGTPVFRTYSAAADFRTRKAFGAKDAFGIGFVFMGDQAGAADYGTLNAGLSVAYFKSLNYKGTNYIGLGFQAALSQRALNTTKLCFGSNYDGSGCNTSLPSDPSIYEAFDASFLMYDINAGIVWFMKINDRSSAYAGFAMHHLNRPNESFFRGIDTFRAEVPFKYTGHLGLTIGLSKQFDMTPKAVVLYQGNQWETNFGTDVRFLFDRQNTSDNNNFGLGFLYRLSGGDNNAAWEDQAVNSESIIVHAQVEYVGISVGVSYDISLGEVGIASRSKGAFEIAGSYTGCFKKRNPRTLFCPHF